MMNIGAEIWMGIKVISNRQADREEDLYLECMNKAYRTLVSQYLLQSNQNLIMMIDNEGIEMVKIMMMIKLMISYIIKS